MAKNKKFTGYVVSETHWDREWYLTFQAFRKKLVDMIDHLLVLLEKDPDYKKFTLDGQTVVLEDYLEIRPGNRDKLKKYIQEGRIAVGPWYVLPDEFLVSGESMVRNLMLGSKAAADFGKVMQVGYVPDSFGHLAQLPQILRGFDLDNFIFMRGMPDVPASKKSEFWWEALDGTRVLAVRQVNSYGNFSTFPHDKFDWQDKARVQADSLKEFATTSVLLYNNGHDHKQAMPEIPKVISTWNKNNKDVKLIHGTFEDYMKALKKEPLRLETQRGELRSSDYHFLLPGVLSARLYLKQANWRCQRDLEKYAEPLAALAWASVGRKAPYMSDYLWLSWKWLLKNHPHDSICGCSIDQVHTDMMFRFDQSRLLAREVVNQSMANIAGTLNTAGPAHAEGTVPVMVFNPHPWTNNGVVSLVYPNNDLQFHPDLPDMKSVEVLDHKGDMVAAEVKQLGTFYDWNGEDRNELAVQFQAENMPPCGYRTYYLKPSAKKAKKGESRLKASRTEIETPHFKVKFNPNGSMNLYDKASKARYNKMLMFEDQPDAGDEYNYSPLPKKNHKILTTEKARAKIKLVSQSPFQAVYSVETTWNLPAGLPKDDRTRMLDEKRPVKISSRITFYADIARVDVSTTINNTAEDHRLRVLFPTPVKIDFTHSDGQLGMIKRLVECPKVKNLEVPVNYHPQQAFVNVTGHGRGLTVANRGLTEYEVYPARGGKGVTVALTLLRSVGWLSRADLLWRKYNAGPSIPTPEAQCLGENTVEYSIIPHKGNWMSSGANRLAYEFNSPLVPQITTLHKGARDLEFSYMNLEPRELVLSAVKKSERGNELVVRVYNVTGRTVQGKLNLGLPVKKARLLKMNEKPAGKKNLGVKKDNSVEFPVKAHQIITIGLVCEK